jgi:ferredoxin
MSADPARMIVDPIRCEGHGLCAELVPERITLDDWGYPIVDPAGLTADELVHAQRAVDSCPALALKLGVLSLPPRASGRRATAGRGAPRPRPARA